MGRNEIEDGRLSEPMTAQAVVFKCPICSTLLTQPLLPLSADQKICLDDGKDAVPQGRFATSSGDYWTSLEGCVLVNIADVIGAKTHPDASRLNGCCGLDGLNGPNLLCENGHEVATAMTDCWMAHAVALIKNVAQQRTPITSELTQ
jgi:hypothetical protein